MIIKSNLMILLLGPTVDPRSQLIQDVDYTVLDNDGNYTVTFLTEFPDQAQGFYRASVEDDAGNRNIVSDRSTEQSIWVDNVEPVLQSAVIDGTGRAIKLNLVKNWILYPMFLIFQ